ncbi:metallophosphoesterase family protein [Limibacter armeniacum]|uniref:metallophosphoesterase family protein n=1 Tax=Limibacter armeniacum TaxID=466084 RepID=UPI002FE651B3
MKIAFISDIHANMPALEAVLADIDSKQPDYIYCLGDLVGYNCWPNEVVEELRRRKIPTIMGNHDEAMITAEPDRFTNRGITVSMLSEDNRQFLSALPYHQSLVFESNEQQIKLLMVHGSVDSNTEYLTSDYPKDKISDMMENSQTDILLCGHTHKPYHRRLALVNQGKTIWKHVINTGSVGKPKDGDNRACYVMLELDQYFSEHKLDKLNVKLHRVSYKVDIALDKLSQSLFPLEYIEALRLAK